MGSLSRVLGMGLLSTRADEATAARQRAESIKLLIVIGILAVVAIGWRISPYRFGVIVGDSMSPTLKPNHLFLMEIGAYANRAPGIGDIVVLRWNGETVVKRVVAGPGELVWLIEYVADKSPLHARYVIHPSELNRLRAIYSKRPGIVAFKQIKVPKGHVYVVGDSQGESLDSRHFGPIPISEIVGRVILPYAQRYIPSPLPQR